MSFGFGSGFGATSSPFGTTSPSPFGQSTPAFGAASTPAFGQNTSPFGATTSTGVFGQQQSQPAFGAPAPAFGASTPAFGAAPTPAFGASSAPAFGSTSFGAKPAGGFGFGAASTPSAFGAASAPAFGASSSAFGAPSPFGGGGSTFGQSAPAFGAASTPAFGQAAPAFGAAAPAFGQQPAAGGFGTGQAFGAPAGGGRGSRVAPWRKTQETDQSSTGTKTTVYFNSISCMPEYAGKSPEELRWEDYQDGVKGGSGAASPGQSGGLFGQPSVSPSPFGQPAASSPFGAPTSTPAFGAASTPAFGAASTPAFGGFGAASTPAFGGISSPAFGGFGAASTPAFGATSAPAFGATSTPAFGGFGAASTPAFGAASSSAFGAPSSTAAFGFGATSTPAFGATSTPAFGAASTPAFGGFGAASTPAFGATSAPAFGATSTPAFSFSAASTPAFGATSAPAFGAASTPLFGAASTPAFGSTGGSLFGGAAQKPATGGFSFTPTSTPAFGATSTPAFGAPSSGGLFGAASTPAFGTGTGGLFGAQTSTPAFSFSSQPAAGQLALVPAGGVGQAQPPGVATSPYGTLPEAPKVTPLPEYRVGLTQRMLAPPSGGPPRPVALITPRSLTPHGGAKLRPRRPVSATRMSRSPAEFFAAAAAGAGGTLGLGLTPSTVSTTPGNGSVNGTPGSSNIFVPRDNPRKLFIREPLPSTEAAGGVSVSPAAGGNGANGTPARSLRTPGSGLKLSPGMRRPSNDMVNGSGEGLGRLRHENGAGASGQGISDAQVSALLPSLRRQDYYTEPSLVQLAAMAREEPESLAEVANFTVGRRGVGAVRWLEPVDVRGLDLDALVDLARGSVEVYLEGGAKPDVGEGLNRPAEVTMLKVFKLDKDTGKPTQEAEAVERFTRKLKKIAAEQSARFVSYDGATGTWKFEVEHFSRYGLVDGSDEEDETDFGMGDDRTAAAVGGDSDDSDEELGVRRRRGGANAANGSSGEVVVAGEEEGRKGEYREEEEREVAMDEGGIGSEGAPVEGHGEAAPKALLVALPERLGLAPEDLLRIRQGLYSSPGEHPSKQRRMDTAAAYADGPTSMHAPAQPPRPVARNAWKKAATAPVLPPVSIIGAGKLVLASQPSLPLLPATPSPVYPPGPSGVKGMCPVSDGSGMRRDLGQERCLPDYGLLMGGSFRMGWGPGGLFAGHLPGGSAARVGLQRVVVGSGTVRHPASKEHQDRLRGRLEAQLRLHYDASLPDAEVGTAPAPPRWRLRCQRTGGELRALTHKYIALCNEHAAQVSGSEHAVERAILRHQAAAWELIHALFSSLPAEESAQEEDQTMTADGDAFPDGSGAPTMRLAAMQRRAELSRWLRDRSRAAVERAARAAPPGPEGTPARLLALLSGHQLAAAAAAAAVSGDVRLATLLATAGSSGAAKQQIAAQLAVWRDAGFEAHIDPTLRQVYQLLAGHAEQVVPSMALDWRRALGVHLWYVCPPNATAVASMDSYVAAVEAGEAPAPAPIYTEWRRGGGNSSGGMLMLEDGSMHGVDEGLTDVNFELLRLFCVLAEDTGRDPALVGDAVLPRLLRPSGSSPDPLDYSLSWHMLCVLRSLGAVAGSQPEADAAAATAQMGFIAQLEAVGGMAHWAVYAALHIPDAGRRERVVKELLSVHCPEWDGDEEVVTFLLESLQVPKEWVAEARALWARYRQDTIALLEEQIEGGDWAAAHATLCERVAPRWLLSGGAALSNLSDALSELEPHANEVDRAAGAGSWQRGGGLYAAFLFLRELYASLTSDMGDEQPALSYEERMQACAELCERLNDASAAVAVEARGGPHGGMAAVEGEGVPLRRAALARMAQDLALWVLGDARGEGACPGPDHAAMVAGLRSLRHGSAAAAVQMGAVSLAAGIA